jgi:penicillin V acylase-like amidase (Ntn superfamily)
MLTEVATSAASARDAVNQAFHSLDLVSVPRHVVAAGDYTQWSVVRDHDNLVLYVRSYDGWGTDEHDLEELGVDKPGDPTTLGLPTA